MPEDTEEESFEFQNFLPRNIVMDLKKRIMRPVFFFFVVAPDTRPDAGCGYFLHAGHADIENVVDVADLLLLPLVRLLTVQDVDAPRDMANLVPIAPRHVKATSFDEAERGLWRHGQNSKAVEDPPRLRRDTDAMRRLPALGGMGRGTERSVLALCVTFGTRAVTTNAWPASFERTSSKKHSVRYWAS
jgi:hypothetical protein